MKKFFVLAVLITAMGKLYAQPPVLSQENDSVTPFYQVIDSIFQNVDLSTRLPTGYLAERAFLGSNLFAYNGNLTDSTSVNAYQFQRLYNIMFTGYVNGPDTLEFWDSIQPLFDEEQTAGKIPIGIFAWQYDRIKSTAFDSGQLQIVNSRYLSDPTPLPSSSPFFTDSVFAAAPVVTYIDTEDVTFVVPSALVIENFPGAITSIQIDFADGNGFQAVTPGQDVHIHYDTTGTKEIQYEIYFSGGTVLRGYTTLFAPFFRKSGGTNLLNLPFWPGFTASEPFDGKFASADVSVRLNCRNNNKLMKPFIVVPGIDPPTIKAFNFGKEGETFETFLANEFGTGMINLASDLNSFLLSEGYDLIYINYRDGGDFIQRNAQLVKSVIREVNNQKLLNGSTEPTTIMGISMGGLVARWALLEMEDASEQHDVENFISYDVPYNGANVPIAFQAMLNHVYDMNIWVGSYALGIPIFIPLPIRLFVPEIGDAEKILGCNAALQLLKHHTYSNTLYPMVPTSTSFRNTMMSFLDSKGFPSQVSSRGKQIKNVALLNGADNVTDQGIGNSSTFLAIDIERKLIIPPLFNIMPHVSLLGFKTDVETWSMPIAIQGKKRIYRGLYTGILSLGGWFTTFIIAGQKDEIEDGIGIDNVPGSFQSIKANTGGVALGGATLEQLGISIHTDRFTFNPTISSSALVSPFRDNLEYDIDGNFDNLLQNWTNNESQINNYEIPKNSSNVTINTSHTAWYPRASTFIQNLHVPAYSGTVGVILSNSPISSGEVYNYGQGTTNRLPFSSGLYTININGGSVKINSDEKVGYTPDLNNNNSSPPAGSTFKVFSSISDGCGGVTSIGISNGGQLIVGDNSVNNMGELYMKEGSSIDILDDGILIIHNNSKVVIEEGATLTYHPGAQILLDGENAVLEIRGTLKIMDGANFTFGKSSGVLKAGFIRFDLSHFTSGGIEVTGTTAEINLPGNNDPLLGSDKVLEIIGGELTTPDGSVTSPELAAFNISNGWVQYSSGGALGISVPGNFSETYFIGSGSAGSEKGLIVYMPSIVSISECRFNQLERGVVLYMDNGFTGTYTIDNSTFDVNERGIEAIEGSLEIVNCDFKYNTEYGVYAPSLEGDCEFNDCYFLDNGVGINMHSNASSPVNCYVFHSGFENNDVGISTTSSQKVNLTLECNKFKNNDEGIAAGGELNLSPNLTLGGHSGGDNVFYDDSVASISTYYSLYLQNGNNSFINSSGVSTTLIATYGNGLITCSSYPCLFYQSSTVIAGANNFWSGSFVNILFDASSNSLTIGGPNNSSFTSSCFYIPSGTEPQFVSTGLPPFSKHDYTMDVQPEVKGPELRVFPNPATNNLFIQTPAKGDNTYTVSIFDIAGKKLLSETFSVSNYAVLAMPVDALSSGTYFIKITTLDGTVNENRKIVILK